jgi:hypothetical protein
MKKLNQCVVGAGYIADHTQTGALIGGTIGLLPDIL